MSAPRQQGYLATDLLGLDNLPACPRCGDICEKDAQWCACGSPLVVDLTVTRAGGKKRNREYKCVLCGKRSPKNGCAEHRHLIEQFA